MSDTDRPWWSSGATPGATAAPGPAAADHAEPDVDARAGAAPHGGDVCQVCPICTAMRLAGEVRPDLLVHLTEAARHLTLAAKTVIDAHASGFGDGGLEHIPLDDDPQ